MQLHIKYLEWTRNTDIWSKAHREKFGKYHFTNELGHLSPVQPNVIEDDKGKDSTSFQHKVHMSPSGPSITPPEVPVPPTRVNTAQNPRVDTGGPSYNLISRGKKIPIPLFSLISQFQKTNESLKWPRNTDIWSKAHREKFGKYHFTNELGHLSQGVREVKGTNAVILILKAQVPKEKVTYGKIVCEVKLEKEEKERTRLTIRGNLLDFTGNLSAPTASVTTAKCVFNSVISTPGARCISEDIKHFYLNNIISDHEFMRIPFEKRPTGYHWCL